METIPSTLYLIFTPKLCLGDPWQTLRAALGAGVDLVQWRVKNEVEVGLARCRDLCADFDVPLILNDRPDLVSQYGLAGAHVGQDDSDPSTAREWVGQDRWLGISTHNTAQIYAAEAAGADHLGFGPMFPTETRGYAEGLGPEALREALARTRLPLFAIGGIDAVTLPSLLAVGCRRVAVSRAILAAEDPAAATRGLRDQLHRAGPTSSQP